MADFTFNIAKGFEAYYASLPAANDALVIIPLETAGLEADASLKDYDNLQALLAGSSNEQVTMGRKTLASVTSAVDDTNEWRDIDFADPVWTGATGGAISALLVVYVPDTTAPNDANAIPITKHDFTVTPNGGDITAQVPTGGFLRVQ